MQFFSVGPLQLDITTQAYNDISKSVSDERTRDRILLESDLLPENVCDLRCVVRQVINATSRSALFLHITQLNASAVVDAALKVGKLSASPLSQNWPSLSVGQASKALLQTFLSICNLHISVFDSTTRLKDVSATGTPPNRY